MRAIAASKGGETCLFTVTETVEGFRAERYWPFIRRFVPVSGEKPTEEEAVAACKAYINALGMKTTDLGEIEP